MVPKKLPNCIRQSVSNFIFVSLLGPDPLNDFLLYLLGLVTGFLGLGFIVPAIGLLTTIGSVIWLGLLSRDFFRLARPLPSRP